jgi:hypothetical protein
MIPRRFIQKFVGTAIADAERIVAYLPVVQTRDSAHKNLPMVHGSKLHLQIKGMPLALLRIIRIYSSDS